MSDKVSCPSNFTPCGSIIVKVKDSGAGMTPEQVGQLFQEGVQFDYKLQAGQGSGLGLWISKGVAEQHGGSLQATSEGKGYGAEFIFELPVCSLQKGDDEEDEDEEADYRKEDKEEASREEGGGGEGGGSYELTNVPTASSMKSIIHFVSKHSNSSNYSINSSSQKDDEDDKASVSSNSSSLKSGGGGGGGSSETTTEMRPFYAFKNHGPLKHILLVDDGAATRKMMSRLLKNCGCTTQEACNGQECLDIIIKQEQQSSNSTLQNKIELILMDHEMPIMNGPTATRKLQELGCKIPVVGLTGNVLSEDKQNFKDHGAIHVLAKPVNVATLKQIISGTQYYDSSTNQSFTPPPSPTPGRSGSSSSRSGENVFPSTIAPSLSTKQISQNLETDQKLQMDKNEKRSIIVKNKSSVDDDDEKESTPSSFGLVLVVDDVASTRKVLCRLLQKCQCDTLEAADGQQCLDIIGKHQPKIDLILMDYEMPIMNGPTATCKLRELGYKMPIIGVTGNVLKSDTDFFKEQGATQVIHKPLNVKVVRDILSRELKYDPLPSPTSPLYFPIIPSPSSSPSKLIIATSNPLENKTNYDTVVDDEWCMMALNL
eukprot:CAMPEP_0114411440 /NCGR_PEP_ID=MMETSP0102-20121206/24668_1 /TAXON_ID=38822 ORGANISM="Pteridomonas danica, Strain PT" /NCGR_SAMPLE_ID=MMETSP0102 /ASSEMBLY_ACC=CAM_ASM_000212 /LENGTH=598 /DNA_ID=CAMNT_0001579357 /DNA_START=1484 /DNA_END=3280 /DNA_ORIENTATION=-